jgi:hypothetical protein
MKSVKVNERRTAKMNFEKTVLWVTAILVIWSGSAVAQQSFRDLAKEYGADWLAGRWTATTDDGTEIQLVYEWELDGHLVTVDLKMGEYASRGMIFYVPGEEKATGLSVDNRGGRAKGTWEVHGYKLVSRSEHVDTEGEVRKYAAVYSRVAPNTIKIDLYGVDQNDELNDESWGSLDFKRQVGKTTKKTDSQAGKQKKSN